MKESGAKMMKDILSFVDGVPMVETYSAVIPAKMSFVKNVLKETLEDIKSQRLRIVTLGAVSSVIKSKF